MKKVRPAIIIFIGITILLIVGFTYDFLEKAEPVRGDGGDNVSGWGWSDTIGWIAFNCTDAGCGSSNFGINIDFGTGDFSGYAWSDNIGWITLDPVGGHPGIAGTPTYSACIDISGINTEPCDGVGDLNVAGWARAVICETTSCSGWDGWILLGDSSRRWHATSTEDDQIRIDPNTNEFRGWAWGSEVVGWISFNCLGPDMCGI